jgi:branched-chain amino acid transport system substrate-binding protein
MPAALTRAATAAALCVLLAGCGSRVDGTQILAESGNGGTVRLSPESIDALRARAADRTAATPAVSTAAETVVEAPRATPIEEVGSTAPVAGSGDEFRTAQRATARTAPVAAAAAEHPSRACPPGLAPIKVGHVGLFSGIAGPITGSAPPAMAAWAKDVNARGGLACRQVQVLTRDDGGDPTRSAAIVNDLVKREGVVAFVAPLTILSASGFVPAVEKAGVPVVGGSTVSDAWFSSPWFFPDGVSPMDLSIGVVRHGVERGKTKLGVLYCVEASACTNGLKLIRDKAAAAAGATLVFDAPVSVTQPDFTAQCLNAHKAGVDQLLLAVDGASMGRVARSCASVGFKPLISTIAAALSNGQARDTTLRSFGVVTANSTAPWTQNDTPGLRDYHRAMKRWLPTAEPDGTSISTWTSAKLFETALAAAPRSGALTAAAVLAGLGTITKQTLGGLTGPITFTPGQKHATSNGCVFYQLLTTEGWTAPRGSRPVCRAN